MKITTILITAFLTLCFLVDNAKASITITNFSLTETSVSFDISGTLPAPLPADTSSALFFVNSNPAASPGFALGSFLSASSYSFSGSQSFSPSAFVQTGNSSFGDYFHVWFQSNLTVGETVSGTLTATWATTAFNPSQATSLDVYWGIDDSLPLNPATQPSAITGGTYLTSVNVVPEPSTTALLVGGGLAVLALLRKRKK